MLYITSNEEANILTHISGMGVPTVYNPFTGTQQLYSYTRAFASLEDLSSFAWNY